MRLITLSLLLLVFMSFAFAQNDLPASIGQAWKDRRPIAQYFISQGQFVTKDNPSGYLNKEVNVSTLEGKEAFRKLLMESADRWVGILKENNAQGMIVWDLEGYSQAGMVYVGDPRVLPEYAPEMDVVAEEFFKKFVDAGIRTGVTIRPNRIFRIEGEAAIAKWGKWGYNYQRQSKVVSELSSMITYAKRRFGCTIFYMDSNSYTTDDSKDGFTPSAIITAAMLKELRILHPDVLIIPEHPIAGGHEWTAQYRELRGGWKGTPDAERQKYPGAFSVLSFGGGKEFQIEQNWETLVNSIAQGDVAFISGWYPAGENQLVKYIWRQAEYQKSKLPTGTDEKSVPELLKLLEWNYQPVRFLAVRALANIENTTQIEELIKIARKDNDWVIQKEAIIALGKLKTVDAIPVLKNIDTNNIKGLRYFAKTALTQIRADESPFKEELKP
ncbi:MAG: HEAT repeat domain-containing protein [bacterium]